ncbi:hypothetical protein EK904_014608, partial [Melospiza melodia maxima]
NQAEVARVLLAKGASADLLNNAKCTALFVAVSQGFTEVVRALCELNCDVNLPDSQGDTPLHYAITLDYRVVIEILTEVPNIDFTVQNCQGFNLLHYAALKGNKLAIKKILARARQLVDSKKEDGFTALHLAALNNHMEVAEILIKEGRCDVNVKNSRKQSPLHLAVIQGHVAMVQLLVSQGSDVNAEDEDGDTAMHMALERQQLLALALEKRDGEMGATLLAKGKKWMSRASSEQTRHSEGAAALDTLRLVMVLGVVCTRRRLQVAGNGSPNVQLHVPQEARSLQLKEIEKNTQIYSQASELLL